MLRVARPIIDVAVLVACAAANTVHENGGGGQAHGEGVLPSASTIGLSCVENPLMLRQRAPSRASTSRATPRRSASCSTSRQRRTAARVTMRGSAERHRPPRPRRPNHDDEHWAAHHAHLHDGADRRVDRRHHLHRRRGRRQLHRPRRVHRAAVAGNAAADVRRGRRGRGRCLRGGLGSRPGQLHQQRCSGHLDGWQA